MNNMLKVGIAMIALSGSLFSIQSVFAATKATTTQATNAVATAKSININTATVDQLASIKGLSKKNAQDIYNYRMKNGSFKSINDLTKVNGIDSKTFAKIKPMVTIK